MLSLQGFTPSKPLMLPEVLQSLNPLCSLSVTHQKLARPAYYNLSNSFLDVTPVESKIQCFIHPAGSVTVNRLKMVILLSGNTTWHGCRPTHAEALRHTETHTSALRMIQLREKAGEQ